MEKRVFKLSNSDYDYAIINAEKIEIKNDCECYDNYGQKIGCYDAGCYSLDNSASDAIGDCLEAIYKYFDVEHDQDHLSDEYFENIEDNELLQGINIDEIKSFIKSWAEENVSHAEVEVFEYFDNNWNTLYIDNPAGNVDLESIDEDLEEKILAEYETAEFEFDSGFASCETENYKFYKSQFSSDYSIARVDEK